MNEKLKVNMPLFNIKEEAELENKLSFHLDEYTNEIIRTMSKDKEIIILKKVIEKQQVEAKRLQKEIEIWKETENDYEHELVRKDAKIENQQKEIKRLKEIEQAHKEENGKLRVGLEEEKNKNKVIEIFRKDMPKDTEIICMRKEDFERNYSSEYISKDKIKELLHSYSVTDERFMQYLNKLLEEK